MIFLQGTILYSAFAGFERGSQAPSIVARGQSGVALYDQHATLLNPASSGKYDRFFFSTYYTPSQFELSQLSYIGAMVSIPTTAGNISSSITTFGFSLYRENTFSINYAHHTFENASFGISLDVNHLILANYGNASALCLNIGTIISVVENLNIGVSIFNLSRTMLANSNEEIPQTYCTGLSYLIPDVGNISVDAMKDPRFELQLRTGISIQLIEEINISGGVWNTPSKIFAGVGFHVSSFQIDYALTTHQLLGYSQTIGVSYCP